MTRKEGKSKATGNRKRKKKVSATTSLRAASSSSGRKMNKQKLAKPVSAARPTRKGRAKEAVAAAPRRAKAGRASFIASATHTLADLQAAKQEWSSRVLVVDSSPAETSFVTAARTQPNENVTGVGIAEKFVEGKPTGVMAVKFFVRRKHPESRIARKDRLPKSINGLPVDVEEVEIFRPLLAPAAAVVNQRGRVDPAQPGCSIGFRFPASLSGNVGTFGALVQDSVNTYILSNNHVLAFENGAASIGSSIFQPGPFERDPRSEMIATLDNMLILDPNICNQSDCAIAKVTDTSRVSNFIIGIGPPRGVGVARVPMSVHKFGRTSGYTSGVVSSDNFDVKIVIRSVVFKFCGQIIIEGDRGGPFADDGDSGALVVDRVSQAAVGLLMGIGAGRDGHSYVAANHLGPIFSRLNLSLV